MDRVTLVLFDIDGTLLRSGGGGRGAMSKAAGRLFGRSDLFDEISFAGAVDSEIVARALAQAGIPPTDRRVGRMRATYGRVLRRDLPQRRGSVCPGVPEAVAAVAKRAKVGLLTGNWPEGAQTKLEVYRLWPHFVGCVGAFGCDAQHRNDLVPIAVRRGRRRWGHVDRAVVVGDTPADVAAARAGHRVLKAMGTEVVSVVVKTGFSTPDDLEAAGPDVMLDDLESGLGALLATL